MKSLLFTFVVFVVFTGALFAQSTTVKLPTADTTSSFVVTDNNNNVLLKIFGWGAFRAGSVNATQWNPAYIGQNSSATGYNTTASGVGSTAMGGNTEASATVSTAMGNSTIASGANSTAMGYNTTASGLNSTAMGYLTTASYPVATAMGSGSQATNQYATAMGLGTTASGSASTTMGGYTTANGNYSTAMGYNTIAYGNYTTAIGNYVSTSIGGGYTGSCIIGDNSTTTTTNSSASNQMMMRFAGGYVLWTNSAANVGTSIGAGDNTWSSVSDSTKKEYFAKADGEYFLHSISQLRLGSWNYKSQDAKHYRHYGPMAQEVFHYFGKDAYGTIGNDTTLGSANMDGIEMICLQALEKRTSELQKAQEKISALEASLNKLSAVVQTLVDEKKNVSMNVVESKEQ